MPSSLRVLGRCVAALLAALLPVASALAATPPPLRELEGHYEYREGATLFLVADGDRLVAILGDGKYPLRATGVDTFVNGVGDAIPFLRDGAGRIVAFKEKGDTFKRLSPDVPGAVRSFLRPRPPVPDGKPPGYRYERPADHADGIRVGALGPGTLSREAAERLVAGVIDGTYADVRSILVYQAGALRLEEYFYGYDLQPAAPDAVLHQERDRVARRRRGGSRKAPCRRAHPRAPRLRGLREPRSPQGPDHDPRSALEPFGPAV